MMDSKDSAVHSPSNPPSHKVIRGFTLTRNPSFHCNPVSPAAPIPKSAFKAASSTHNKNSPSFTGLSPAICDGRSPSTGFRFSDQQMPVRPQKQTTFKEEVALMQSRRPSMAEADHEVSESAIEDDDEWEDTDSVSGPSSLNESEMFKRVDSRANIPSRRSLITIMRESALRNSGSKSPSGRHCSLKGPSLPSSPEEEGLQMNLSNPIIMTTSNTHPHPSSLSPRTTRRRMFATELTESLRTNLLWERHQKNPSSSTGAFKRRNIPVDANYLQHCPEDVHPVLLNRMKEESAESWNMYFDQGLLEYHQTGW